MEILVLSINNILFIAHKGFIFIFYSEVLYCFLNLVWDK